MRSLMTLLVSSVTLLLGSLSALRAPLWGQAAQSNEVSSRLSTPEALCCADEAVAVVLAVVDAALAGVFTSSHMLDSAAVDTLLLELPEGLSDFHWAITEVVWECAAADRDSNVVRLEWQTPGYAHPAIVTEAPTGSAFTREERTFTSDITLVRRGQRWMINEASGRRLPGKISPVAVLRIYRLDQTDSAFVSALGVVVRRR